MCYSAYCGKTGEKKLFGYCIHCWPDVPAEKKAALLSAKAEAEAVPCPVCGSADTANYCARCGATVCRPSWRERLGRWLWRALVGAASGATGNRR